MYWQKLDSYYRAGHSNWKDSLISGTFIACMKKIYRFCKFLILSYTKFYIEDFFNKFIKVIQDFLILIYVQIDLKIKYQNRF